MSYAICAPLFVQNACLVEHQGKKINGIVEPSWKLLLLLKSVEKLVKSFSNTWIVLINLTISYHNMLEPQNPFSTMKMKCLMVVRVPMYVWTTWVSKLSKKRNSFLESSIKL